MSTKKALLGGLVALTIAAGVGTTAGATSLVRQGLDGLVATHRTVVLAEVVDARSYWNDEGTFILTDVELSAVDVVKGDVAPGGLTVTLLGGTVGELTTLIVGGAELVPGRFYVLFLEEEGLPGRAAALTVRDHVQGAFEVRSVAGELRAVSQANGHPLLPDASGYVDAPGGVEGLPLEAMLNSVRELSRPSADLKEVK